MATLIVLAFVGLSRGAQSLSLGSDFASALSVERAVPRDSARAKHAESLFSGAGEGSGVITVRLWQCRIT